MSELIFAAAVIFFGFVDIDADLKRVEFVQAVEEFVQDTCPDGIPRKYDNVIRGMGDSDYRIRDLSKQKLFDISSRDFRWVFWGMRDKSPEISLRSYYVLRKLLMCDACRGHGNKPSPDPWTGGILVTCWNCAGRGSIWPYSYWDINK